MMFIAVVMFAADAVTSPSNLRLMQARKIGSLFRNNSTAIYEGINSNLIHAVQFASADAQGLAAYQVGVQGAACGCMFDGYCSCDTAQRFMSCIAKACDDHKCDCQDGLQFMYACHNMSAVCPSVGLSCSHKHAVCVTTEWVTESKPEAPVKAPVPEQPKSKAQSLGVGSIGGRISTAVRRLLNQTESKLEAPVPEELKSTAQSLGVGSIGGRISTAVRRLLNQTAPLST